MAASDNKMADTGEKIFIGKGEQPVWLTLGLANRHGLVTASGLRPEARYIRQTALEASLTPTQYLGTETIARMLGLRLNHPRAQEPVE